MIPYRLLTLAVAAISVASLPVPASSQCYRLDTDGVSYRRCGDIPREYKCYSGETNGVPYYSSCDGVSKISRVAPSTDMSPQENLMILADQAKRDLKELEATWFANGKKLDAARERVKTYTRLLSDLKD